MECNGTLQGSESFPSKTCKSSKDSFAASSVPLREYAECDHPDGFLMGGDVVYTVHIYICIYVYSMVGEVHKISL